MRGNPESKRNRRVSAVLDEVISHRSVRDPADPRHPYLRICGGGERETERQSRQPHSKSVRAVRQGRSRVLRPRPAQLEHAWRIAPWNNDEHKQRLDWETPIMPV